MLLNKCLRCEHDLKLVLFLKCIIFIIFNKNCFFRTESTGKVPMGIRAADPDQRGSALLEKLDTDTHLSKKLDPDPHSSQNSGALEAQN